jgi:hypothetical protein
MIATAVVLLIFGGEGDTGGDATPGTIPTLELVYPAPNATVENPLELRFRSDATLTAMPGGWGVRGLHLHAEIDGVEFMPSAADLRRLQDGSYQWALGRLQPGTRTLRIFWSDSAHRPLTEGATPHIRIQLR